jgi:hypothetical protein
MGRGTVEEVGARRMERDRRRRRSVGVEVGMEAIMDVICGGDLCV